MKARKTTKVSQQCQTRWRAKLTYNLQHCHDILHKRRRNKGKIALAQQLQQRYQSEFYLERLQVDWVSASRWYPFLLCVSVGALYGLLLGICAGLWRSINSVAGTISVSEGIRAFLLFGLIIACLYIGLNTLVFQWVHVPRVHSSAGEEGSGRQVRSPLLARIGTNRLLFGFVLGSLYGLWLFLDDMLLIGPVLPPALIDVCIWTPLAIMIAIVIGPFDSKIQLMEVMTWSWTHVAHGLRNENS